MSYTNYMLRGLLQATCHAKHLEVNCGAKRLECVELAPAVGPPHALRPRQQAPHAPNAPRLSLAALLLCAFALLPLSAPAQDWPQWGGTPARNMYCPATNLPDHFTTGKSGDIKFKGASEEIDRSNTENLKWVTKLGSQSYGNVTVAHGRVFIGTNNENPRDPRSVGDRSILMCFDEKSGELLWQLSLIHIS